MQCLLCNRLVTKRLAIRDLLWPGKIEWPVVCEECWSRFTAIHGPACPVCSAPQSTATICRECRRWRSLYQWQLRHTALYRYNEAMKDFMHRYKFNGDYRLRAVFQPTLVAAVKKLSADLVVPIPVTATTMQTRGFNQVTGLLTGVPLTTCLTARVKDKTAQSKKNRHERLQAPQPFTLVDPAQLVGKRVLLVDDVYTTGRTIYHAANLVYGAGATTVISVSLAR